MNDGPLGFKQRARVKPDSQSMYPGALGRTGLYDPRRNTYAFWFDCRQGSNHLEGWDYVASDLELIPEETPLQTELLGIPMVFGDTGTSSEAYPTRKPDNGFKSIVEAMAPKQTTFFD